MSRFAIFIDAGYLLAWGAAQRAGRRAPRTAASYDPAALITAIAAHCSPLAAAGDTLLRLYWYDGAPATGPLPEHNAVGQLPDVKVRLGRLRRGEQKGVDTLIVLDLTTLARERAISSAFLLSGDEDLREGVLVAQQLGIRVVMLGLQATSGQANQSGTLIQEADHTLDCTPVEDPLFTHVNTPPFLTGQTFGQTWVPTATQAALGAVQATKAAAPAAPPPPMPGYIWTQLRAAALTALAPQPLIAPLTRLEPWQEQELRRGFWAAIP